MIPYRIIRHIPGRIKIEVRFIKNIPLSELLQMPKKLSTILMSEGIKEIRPSLISGTVVIIYEYGKINILEYLKNLSSNIEIQKLIGGRN